MSCPDCFRGTTHIGNPQGTEETIHGLPVYVTTPADGVTPKGLIVYIPDAFGWDFVNNRILADHYAKRGNFLVYVPDFMGGYSMPTNVMTLMDGIMEPRSWFDTIFYKPFRVIRALSLAIPFLIRNRPSVAGPRIYNFFKAVRTSAPPFPTSNLKVGAAGFCWGGKYTIDLAADVPSTRVERHSSQTTTGPQPLIDCGFTAHPSAVKVPTDIEAVTLPLSVTIGDTDMAMKSPLIRQMNEILTVKKGDHEVVIIPGAKHGFAQRTATDNPKQMEDGQRAEDQAISWFTRWFT